MGEKTGIGWTDSTHNFWFGCEKVSQGCKFCYAEREMTRYGREFGMITRAKGFDKPLHWKTGRKIFVNSWSDFFIQGGDAWRDAAWDIIRHTPQHTYQILTKRPELINDRLPKDWGGGYANVWLGASAEDQENLDQRIPILLEIPARIHFVSVEPMLGRLNMRKYLKYFRYEDFDPVFGYLSGLEKGLDWVICGCESGPKARPMDYEWVQDLANQLVLLDIPFFLKQRMINGALVKEPEPRWLRFPEVE